MAINHITRAQAAWPILIRTARRRARISYSELCGAIGLHPRAATHLLNVIYQYCLIYELPPIVALAVSKSSQLPGVGYTITGRGGFDYEALLEEIYDFDWPDRVPNFALIDPKRKITKNID
ncbi:hypothetical protein [Aquirhabdus parva]|uniref:Uncharacterized protein n=1 Tax=Aquirhabdus parva TaxID=2283318 RepID=A0A345P608_9GAMM|nr:hypothetical protein [Aquirhabdus parva]AXI02717.1 hypothetical protein HYN46_07645 [Aquirhabdus parva]